jgi:hypothetical protein
LTEPTKTAFDIFHELFDAHCYKFSKISYENSL